MVVVALELDSVPPPRHLLDSHQAVTPQLLKSQTNGLVGGALVDGDSRVAGGHHLQAALVAVLGALLVVLLVALLVVLLLRGSVDSD